MPFKAVCIVISLIYSSSCIHYCKFRYVLLTVYLIESSVDFRYYLGILIHNKMSSLTLDCQYIYIYIYIYMMLF